MTDKELIARLRDRTVFGTPTATAAADRIEALIAEQSNLVVAAHRQGYDQARAVSSELRRAMAERIMEHEAKLAKTEGALEKLARLGNGDRYGNSEGNMIALATLAEIKGERHE